MEGKQNSQNSHMPVSSYFVIVLSLPYVLGFPYPLGLQKGADKKAPRSNPLFLVRAQGGRESSMATPEKPQEQMRKPTAGDSGGGGGCPLQAHFPLLCPKTYAVMGSSQWCGEAKVSAY